MARRPRRRSNSDGFRFGDRRTSRRFSPRVPAKRAEEPTQPNFGAPRPEVQRQRDYDIRQGSLYAPGRAELYTIESQQNYESAYARYDRSISMFPDRVDEEEQKYFFFSNRAPDSEWTVCVTTEPPQIGLVALSLSDITIICPPAPPNGLQLGPEHFVLGVLDNSIQEFLDINQFSLLWTQIAGDRQLTIEPNNVIYPFLTFGAFGCVGLACPPGDETIILRLTLVGTDAFFDVPVETRLLENFSKLPGIGQARAPRQEAQILSRVPAPREISLAYRITDFDPDSYRFHFPPPERRSALILTEVSLNDGTGNYILSESFLPSQPVNPNIPRDATARISTIFDRGGVTTSQTVAFNARLDDRDTLADETLSPLGFGLKVGEESQIISPRTVASKEFQDEVTTIFFGLKVGEETQVISPRTVAIKEFEDEITVGFLGLKVGEETQIITPRQGVIIG